MSLESVLKAELANAQVDIHRLAIQQDDVGAFATSLANAPFRMADAPASSAIREIIALIVNYVVLAFLSPVMMAGNIGLWIMPIFIWIFRNGHTVWAGEAEVSWISVGAFVAAGFGVRSELHTRFEAKLPRVRGWHLVTGTFAAVNLFGGCWILYGLHGFSLLWAFTAFEAFVLGFVALDHLTIMSARYFRFGMRPIVEV